MNHHIQVTSPYPACLFHSFHPMRKTDMHKTDVADTIKKYNDPSAPRRFIGSVSELGDLVEVAK